ncbi:MAG: SH3 domain-containing protein [Prevotellaceae bacterium]|jgi:uncharacterized protein YgiM (DUF1202 family)|nr:SH3 domain-containing protein [Prevotellaceae bacterium]
MKKYIIYLLTVLVLSCQNKSTTQKSQNTNEEQNDSTTDNDLLTIENDTLNMNFLKLTDMEKEKIKMYVAKYHKKPDRYIISEEEMNMEISIVYQYLTKNNYKFSNDSMFNERINQFFDIDKRKDIDVVEYSKFFYIPIDWYNEYAKMTAQEKKFYIKDVGLQSFENIVFVKNYNFIIIPMDIAEFFDTEENMEFSSRSQKLLAEIYHRNQYLFNNSKSSLTWLSINDKYFLDDLVRVFGYNKELRSNQIVLENISKRYNNTQPKQAYIIRNLFAAKDYNGTLQIREKLLQYTVDNTTVENNKLLNMLYDYANLIFNTYENAYDEILIDFTESDKLKTAAYAGYYIELAYRNNGIREMEKRLRKKSFLRSELAGNKELLHEIDKNNYYGLPDFAGMIDDIMTEISETDKNTYIIEDPDGYVNVREGKGTSYNITGTIPSGKQIKLLISPEESNWWRVKYQDIVGYVHKSRIKPI